MDRRTFLAGVGLGYVATTLPSCRLLSAGVAQGRPVSPIAVPSGGVPVGSLTALDQAGFLLDTSNPFGPVLVVRDPANPATVLAVDPTCPHAGCQVDWQGDRDSFVCPCHAATFTAAGTVTGGPTRQNLVAYETRIDNDTIFIEPGANPPPTQPDARYRDDDDDDRDDNDDDGRGDRDDNDDDHDD
ncbi:MAG: Rieske (2Fe-2S) protein [Cyanobacteria bacterium]|nr:Rieske (2Fe-2S) protein [Cyanobacteriota bacterium]